MTPSTRCVRRSRLKASSRRSCPIPELSVSKTHGTYGYGMMGGFPNGRSLILVGPSGKIRWRADYGGEPKYTMYVPLGA